MQRPCRSITGILHHFIFTYFLGWSFLFFISPYQLQSLFEAFLSEIFSESFAREDKEVCFGVCAII